jgi:SP family arabinose:H+ symporter-like MFS transporter
VPPSPRWLIMRGRFEEAEKIMIKVFGADAAKLEIERIQQSIALEENKEEAKLKDLFKPGLRLVLTIGIVVAVLQQITGINSVFFYAPMIFQQSGLGTDASFMQAILVGLVNLAFTVVAILVIDRLGRKPLLSFGVAGIALSMFALSYAFKTANFSVSPALIENFAEKFDSSTLQSLEAQVFTSENDFTNALANKVDAATLEKHQADIVKGSINMNTSLTLFSILAFVASFAISIGPVMWVLFSEIFPNKIRGIAISFVGLINSAISFIVQWIFPWELDVLGNSLTFLIYGLFAAFGLIFIIKVIPETKGKSLEEIEKQLVTKD